MFQKKNTTKRIYKIEKEQIISFLESYSQDDRLYINYNTISEPYKTIRTIYNTLADNFNLQRQLGTLDDEDIFTEDSSNSSSGKNQNNFNNNNNNDIHKNNQCIRNANNFVKSIQFSRYPARRGVVMDLGCGRGQDMNRLGYLNPLLVFFVDISENNLYEAERRWSRNQVTFPACFLQDNFCDIDFLKNRKIFIHKQNENRKKGQRRDSVKDNIEELFTYEGVGLVDIITCQFSLHYAFHSKESSIIFLDNISRILKKGGIFICSFPNSKIILNKLRENTSITDSFQIKIKDDTDIPEDDKSYFPYEFTMKDTMSCIQWTVKEEDLTNMLKERGFLKLHSINNKQCYETEIHTPKHKSMLERMSINPKNDQVNLEQLEMYTTMVFVKQQQ